MQEKINEFFRAIEKNNIELVKNLIKEGVDVNAKNKYGWTALHYAIINNSPEIVKELLASGADVEAENNFGETALDIARNMKSLESREIIEILLKDERIQYEDEKKIVKGLLQYEKLIHLITKIDINSRSVSGETALMFASRNGKIESVKWLIKNGADVNLKSDCGFTALIHASEFGHLEIVKELIANGADINAKDSYGETALTIAVKNGRREIIDLLRKYI